MNTIQDYANYMAAANAEFGRSATPAVVLADAPESPQIDPDPNEGIHVALSAPLAATKNGIGYLKILVHLFDVENEGGFLPDIVGAVPGFDNFSFKIGGGPALAKISRSPLMITSGMSVFMGKNKLGAWMQDRRARPITEDGIIAGFEWSNVPSGPYRISLLSFAIGNGKFNDQFDGVAGTNTHHAETWPNTPYIDVVV